MTDAVPPAEQYADDDLVYVDPDAKTVVGPVTFDDKGNAKKLERPSAFAEADDDESDAKIDPAPSADPAVAAKPEPAKGRGRGGRDRRPPRKPRKRYYPWGTYRTMKKIYKIEGKVFDAERTLTLDDVMEKALQEPYWD
jgi:hypothetical protein